MLQMETPVSASLRAAEIARRHGLKVMLNPAPPTAIPPELLGLVDLLTPNETELEFLLKGLTWQSGSREAALAYLAHKVPNLVVTLGSEGCRVISGEEDTRYPAFPVKAVDSTAAGDAFNAGLAVALARGMGLAEAVRFASAAGALAVTRLGAIDSLPTLAEVEEFLRS
jgi:ribokinase